MQGHNSPPDHHHLLIVIDTIINESIVIFFASINLWLISIAIDCYWLSVYRLNINLAYYYNHNFFFTKSDKWKSISWLFRQRVISLTASSLTSHIDVSLIYQLPENLEYFSFFYRVTSLTNCRCTKERVNKFLTFPLVPLLLHKGLLSWILSSSWRNKFREDNEKNYDKMHS